jgi:NAD(P)-dependent dehydrogenase (short-subunit alcohol dehydrogenase family)
MQETNNGPLTVFGGGNGIGLAVATLASAHQGTVLIADTNPATAELPLVKSGRCEFAQCDASDPTQVQELLDRVLARHGRLGSVVTTVGGAHLHDPLQLDIDSWRKEVAFNLDSAYVVATASAARMAKHGGGAIVTASSTFAYLPAPDRIGYAASKAGVIALTKSLALATARMNIRINCVAPGATDTPRLRRMTGDESELARICEASAQGRIATPEDVAQSILFLASTAAASITGQVIYVNNGSFMP